MKIEIDLPEDKAKSLYDLVKEWKELSPFPSTHYAKLRKVENELGTALAYLMLSESNFLEELEYKLTTNPISEGI